MNSITYTLARYAKLAYEQHTVRLEHDMEVLLDTQGTTGIIAIRGSEGHWKDWAANFMAFPAKCGRIGRAPHGFARRALRLLKYLLKENPEFLANHKSFEVTGHSQGGAVAILVAELMKDLDYNVTQCAAFGAPKTGKRVLRVPTKIYDHAGDVVCKVPWFWRHPVKPIVLPDMTDGVKQHSMNYYAKADDYVKAMSE